VVAGHLQQVPADGVKAVVLCGPAVGVQRLEQRESGPLPRRLVNVLLASPDHDLFGDEPVYWDGKPAGLVRSGGFGHSLGAACGIAGLTREGGISAADLAAGAFEIDIAGARVPAEVSLKPFFDPSRSRILC